MTQAKKVSPAHIIAGILFALMALSQLFSMISFITQHLRYGLIPGTNVLLSIIVFNYGIYIAAYGVTAVCLLMYQFTSARMMSLIGPGALVLLRLFSFVSAFRNATYYVYGPRGPFIHPLCVLPGLVSLAGYIVLLVFAALSLQDQARQRAVRARMLWFVPGLCAFLAQLLTPVVGFILQRLFGLQWPAGTFTFYGIPTLVNLLSNLLFIATFLLTGFGFAFPGSQSRQNQPRPYAGPYQTGGGPVNNSYYGTGSAPGSGYAPGPGPAPGPGSGYVPGPGSGYVPGPGPAPGPRPGYAPGPGYVPGPGPVPYGPSGTAANVAEELRQYKELLDTGVITQEEFAAKKKQLLGL